MKSFLYAHPVLTCQQAREFEPTVLENEAAEWIAVQRAGQAVAEAILLDYRELFDVPDSLKVVALIGKGNNAGDALVACATLMAKYPRSCVTLIMSSNPDDFKPLAKRAYEQIEGRVSKHSFAEVSNAGEVTEVLEKLAEDRRIDVCIDGLLGASFKPPLRPSTRAIIEAIIGFDAIRMRASVDLPSGCGDSLGHLSFPAEFTYATGIAKQVLFDGLASSGRVRYIDLGFFNRASCESLEVNQFVLHPRVLAPLQRLRPASVDKRTFGHLFIIGGSARMPGALLMAVKAAVRSGVGLVTAFAPASVAAVLAAQSPEAMWVPWPETKDGTLNSCALPLLIDRLESCSAVLCGPGMGFVNSTETLVQEIVEHVHTPVVLDADALNQRAIEVAPNRSSDFGPLILTPHMGEFMRIAKLTEPDFSLDTLLEFSASYKVTTVLKASNTRICDGSTVIFNTHGGPVLSRGGSGDLLSGLIGGMIAQGDVDANTAIARGLMLHGLASQRLAREKGQIAVSATQVLDYLPGVLRSDLG